MPDCRVPGPVLGWLLIPPSQNLMPEAPLAPGTEGAHLGHGENKVSGVKAPIPSVGPSALCSFTVEDDVTGTRLPGTNGLSYDPLSYLHGLHGATRSQH